ncbi:MAG: hypothetical protein ACD_2C00188G0006 [uncultured bacterium (gcode 4)]|uniref:Uncharacterized protein n=1 Tax=uncultured bacterium (gcode 4) TaxID=1234023 RepID=K2G2A3_9BACT|nr:MAG: hypothetical protein ACD_2C00188G0006 [uncultured bacterium (gcode 4)]
MPELKLLIDIEQDTDNAKYFIANWEFLEWFIPRDFQYILSDAFTPESRNIVIAEYTKHIYKIRENKIANWLNLTIGTWEGIKLKYYELTDRIFKWHKWLSWDYRWYISVYNMYPRNIDEKYFYFPYEYSFWNPVWVIGHEMLHFIFFDYLSKIYWIEEKTKFEWKPSNFVWQVSETFNNVIEDWKPYTDLIDEKESKSTYPGCEKLYEDMTKIWNENYDIDILLKSVFDIK